MIVRAKKHAQRVEVNGFAFCYEDEIIGLGGPDLADEKVQAAIRLFDTRLLEAMQVYIDRLPEIKKEIDRLRHKEELKEISIRSFSKAPSVNHPRLPVVNPRDQAPGFIYLLKDWNVSDHYKIGLSRNVERRVKQIGYADLIHSFPADNMLDAEMCLHAQFEDQRVEGEWFKLSSEDVRFVESITEFKDDKFNAKEA